MTLLEGKVAIVTGGSRGIGRATAVAREGAKVVVNFDPGADATFGGDAPAQETLVAVKAAGSDGLLVSGDVADPTTATRLVDAAIRTFGGVDIHVSNAGICPFHTFLNVPVELYRRVIDVNLGGAFFTSQAAANRIVKQGRSGAIIAISSISALVGGARPITHRPRPAYIR